MEPIQIIPLVFKIYSTHKQEKKLQSMFEKLDKSISSQLIVMNNIGQGLEELKTGPIYSASIYLSEALKEHRTLKERNENINLAKNSFIQSLGILEAKQNKKQNDIFQIALVKIYIGFCWFLLKKKKDYRDWTTKAIENIDQCTELIQEDTRNTETLLLSYEKWIEKALKEIEEHENKRFFNPAFGAVIGVAALVVHESKTHKMKRKLTDLEKRKETLSLEIIQMNKYNQNLSTIKENMESFLLTEQFFFDTVI